MRKYCQEFMLNPVILCRNECDGKVLIEGSINSVRISFKFKVRDKIDEYLVRLYCKVFMHRCELFDIIRRKPINKDWDLTFLIMFWHLEYIPSITLHSTCTASKSKSNDSNVDQDHPCFDRVGLAMYLSEFGQEFENVISAYGCIFLNQRGRIIAKTWLKQF